MPDEPTNLRQILLLSPLSTSTVTKTFTFKYDIEGSQEEIKNIQDKMTELDNEIIIPILKTDIDNIEVKFNELQPIIASWLNEVITMVVDRQLEEGKVVTRNDFNKIANFYFDSFKEAKKFVQSSSLAPDIRKKIIQTIDNLIDYENVLLGIAIERQEELELALKQIDVDDLKKNLLNALLAFFTVLYVVTSGEKEYDKEKLSKLVNLAKVYSEEMESYVDTIDILSNPKTMELIRKSEEYYNLNND
jgi:hypothetical protein